MRAFLWCCWHIGGSQSDVAHLKAEDFGRLNKTAVRQIFSGAPQCFDG
jgi:hypothetical protein